MTPAHPLLGLSRRPLDPGDEARARHLRGAAPPSPSAGALALLAERELRERVALPTVSTPAVDAPREWHLPPRQPPRPTDAAIAALVAHVLAGGRGALPALTNFLRSRHLRYPSETTYEVARASLSLVPEVRPDTLALLGPRGAWLYQALSSAPTAGLPDVTPGEYLRRSSASSRARSRKTFPTHLALALASVTPDPAHPSCADAIDAFAEALATSAWPLDLRVALEAALRRGDLATAVPTTVLAKALQEPTAQLDALTQARLMRTSGSTSPATRAREAQTLLDDLLSDVQAAGAARTEVVLALDPQRLVDFALACYVAERSATAARGFLALALGGDALRQNHACLPLFVASLDEGDFQRTIGRFVERHPRGSGDPRLGDWLADSPHRLGPELTERLLVGTQEGYGRPRPSYFDAALLRADSGAIAALVHDRRLGGQGLTTAHEAIARAAEAVDRAVRAGQPPGEAPAGN